MKNCTDCGRKVTCCKCDKMLCKSNGSSESKKENCTADKDCSIIGYYKIGDNIICMDCHSQ